MSVYQIYFVSGNGEKLRDIQEVVGSVPNFRIDHFNYSIRELQTNNLQQLVEAKAIAAFARVRYPVIVDHTCLGLKALKGLPGAAASEFWRCVGTDICDIVAKLGDRSADVTVALAFTDGKNIVHVLQKQKGTIAAIPRGRRNFDWDRVFIPKNETRVYAEMSVKEKNQRSPRAQAFEKLVHKIRNLT